MSEIQMLQDTVKKIEEKLDVILNVLMGNPNTPNEPGLLIRLDRLEQSNKFKTKILFLMASGLGMVAGNAIFFLINR